MSESIHYLKTRNSDYLAGVDLEIFDLEGKSKTLTIKKIEFKQNFRVNGKLKDKGLIAYFTETYAKPLIINTTNSKFIKESTGIMDASKWVGFSLDFFFKADVEMRVSKTEKIKGGIRIKKVNTNGLAPELLDVSSRITVCTKKVELLDIWSELSQENQNKHKSEFTEKLKTL